MPKTPPGQTRERVFRYVRERLLAGRPPTIREVQEALQFRAVETARGHLEALIREGRLAKRDGESRGLRLPGAANAGRTQLVPILGGVQAGALNTAIQNLDGYVPVGSDNASDELFALRVRGASMQGASILSGDLVIVRRQPSARSGDIVVALVEDEATVKRLRIRGGRIELHPENSEFDVIVPPRDRCEILGKVIEVRRHLESPSSLEALTSS
jgi:repressor LexA